MNLLFDSLKKKPVILIALGAFVLFLSSNAFSCRATIAAFIRAPSSLANALRREASGFFFYHRNYTRNEQLNQEIGFLKNKLFLAQEVFLENKRLKEMLSFQDESPYKLVAARIIARAQESWFSLCVIDKGSSDGISEGLPVINAFGLVGRVSEVNAKSAKIMLLGDPHFRAAALVQRSRLHGVICGALGNTVLMKYLPEDADIELNDVVITSGLTEYYPKGVFIGTVVEVREEFSGLSRYAVVKPSVDLGRLEEVFIILGNKH